VQQLDVLIGKKAWLNKPLWQPAESEERIESRVF